VTFREAQTCVLMTVCFNLKLNHLGLRSLSTGIYNSDLNL
jgi:hypothetical protein